jgi:hypothetical protein
MGDFARRSEPKKSQFSDRLLGQLLVNGVRVNVKYYFTSPITTYQDLRIISRFLLYDSDDRRVGTHALTRCTI